MWAITAKECRGGGSQFVYIRAKSNGTPQTKLVVHRRGQMGSGSQVSGLLHWTTNLQTSVYKACINIHIDMHPGLMHGRLVYAIY